MCERERKDEDVCKDEYVCEREDEDEDEYVRERERG